MRVRKREISWGFGRKNIFNQWLVVLLHPLDVIVGLDPAIHQGRGLADPWALGSSPRATFEGVGEVQMDSDKLLKPNHSFPAKLWDTARKIGRLGADDWRSIQMERISAIRIKMPDGL